MSLTGPRPGRPSAREAVRLAGNTWRLVATLKGDPCSDCGLCDIAGAEHASQAAHRCTLSPGWFCGSISLCTGCFARRIREELNGVDLRGVAEPAAHGDGDALGRLRDLAG